MIDDSDRWIRIEGADFLHVANDFFLHIVPMLAREVGCGFVIAVHEEYLELESYRAAQEMLSRTIPLPMPDNPGDALAVILNRRIELANLGTTIEDILEPAAIDLLAERYAADRNLRRMLATVDRANQRGCADRVAALSPDLIQTARADLV